MGVGRSVAIVTLGCGRNDVDSDQVAGSLQAAGYGVVDDPEAADCVLVNTCTFIEPARQESIETVLAACDAQAPRAVNGTVPVLVIGCMAQRYADDLAEALPEVAGVVGFADYPQLPRFVARALGDAAHEPDTSPVLARDGGARRSLPLVSSPAASHVGPGAPPNVTFPVRTEPRGPWAYLKIAGGCDRACTFCTIPSYRGRFTSRPLDELLAEAQWLADRGVRELVCVSENTTSWGKDLPGGRDAQADLVAGFERVEGLARVRLLYLQPAELQPKLLDAMAASPVVAGYYDLSLQHASTGVVTMMGRSGGAERFLDLIAGIRARDPQAVFRSSFIVGFPGESEEDVKVLAAFLEAARLDWVGLFTFSAEDGTPSAGMPGQVAQDEARARREHLLAVAEAVAEDQAAAFVGRRLQVLVEERDGDTAVGRSYRESPESDGEVRLDGCPAPVGALVPAVVTAAAGVDLIASFAGSPGVDLAASSSPAVHQGSAA